MKFYYLDSLSAFEDVSVSLHSKMFLLMRLHYLKRLPSAYKKISRCDVVLPQTTFLYILRHFCISSSTTSKDCLHIWRFSTYEVILPPRTISTHSWRHFYAMELYHLERLSRTNYDSSTYEGLLTRKTVWIWRSSRYEFVLPPPTTFFHSGRHFDAMKLYYLERLSCTDYYSSTTEGLLQGGEDS